MYACLYAPQAASVVACQQILFALAGDFSPQVEQTSVDTVVFSIAPLRALFGSPPRIAAEISRQGNVRKLQANLAIAASPDTAILLARHYSGITLASPDDEIGKLAGIPLETLFLHDTQVDAAILETLHQWGLKTCEDLAALLEDAIAERLGIAGVYLRHLALGQRKRPLRIAAEETDYEERAELEYPVNLLEPLLFLFGRALTDLCERLRSQSQAARLLDARLSLESKKEFQCVLEFPVPLDDSRGILKLLQLHLERHLLESAVIGFRLRLEPAAPRRMQNDLFLPPTPQPDRLQVTLARIAALVGEENVGTPELLNSYRPDAFRLTALDIRAFQPEPENPRRKILRLSLRLFRPVLPAQVRALEGMPQHVVSAAVKGRVVERSGPWETSGEWWSTASNWSCAEWDVALDDGALYRIACELPAKVWFVVGMYD